MSCEKLVEMEQLLESNRAIRRHVQRELQDEKNTSLFWKETAIKLEREIRDWKDQNRELHRQLAEVKQSHDAIGTTLNAQKVAELEQELCELKEQIEIGSQAYGELQRENSRLRNELSRDEKKLKENVAELEAELAATRPLRWQANKVAELEQEIRMLQSERGRDDARLREAWKKDVDRIRQMKNEEIKNLEAKLAEVQATSEFQFARRIIAERDALCVALSP